jgi:hypothetical protein
VKNLTLFTITLCLLLSLTLWQQRSVVAAKAPPVPATFNVPAGDVTGLIAAIKAANNETANPGPDTIVLEGGTYSFGAPNNWEFALNALPIIMSDITIEGNGAVLTSTATAGASGLSYDATTDRYTCVWKTEKAWKGMCRKLVVKFTDDTSRAALFQFK